MNRFVTNLDPKVAAQDQCDKHLRKMITEEGQMLSAAIKIMQPDIALDPRLMGMPVNHLKHPCFKWLLEAYKNFDWAMKHWEGIADEYRYRFDNEHGSETRLKDIFRDVNTPDFASQWERQVYTPHPQTFGKSWPHKTQEIWPVGAYRSYMRDYKQFNIKMG